jgi:hypothetical protein
VTKDSTEPTLNPWKKLLGDKFRERRIARTFQPSCFDALRRNEDKPRSRDLGSKIVYHGDCFDAVAVKLSIQENGNAISGCRLTRGSNPNRAFILQMNAPKPLDQFFHGFAQRHRSATREQRCIRKAGNEPRWL